MRILSSFLMPVAAFCFALGLTLPLMRFEKIYFFEERPSLLDIVAGLWTDGEMLLAAIVGAFSIALPGAKIILASLAAAGGPGQRSLSMLAAIGKWSMLDVMLVALVLFAAKTNMLADASALPGLWFYAAATLLTAIAAHGCRR